MMWKILFLLVASAAATDLPSDMECSFNVFHQCQDPEGRPEEFPDTEEKLEKFCKYAVKYFRCINNAIENCNEEDNEITYIRELSSNVLRVCNKDSLLYGALVGSLPCLKRNMNNMTPGLPMSDKTSQPFKDNLARIGITDMDSAETKSSCVHALYSLGSIASRAGKACGDIAREVVVDIIQGFDMPFSTCQPGVKEKFPAIVLMLQLEAEKKEAAEDRIKKKK